MSREYQLTITDDDRGIQFDLTVMATAYPSSPASYSRSYGCWTPGEGPSVDVESVRIDELVTAIGDYGVSANLEELDGPALRHINDEVARKYAGEIESAVLEQCQREFMEAA